MMGLIIFIFQLLSITGVEHDGTPESIVEQTQKHWLRPKGTERWELVDFPQEKRDQIIQIVNRMSFFDEKPPLEREYDYCLIFGAAVGSMELRLNYMKRLMAQGVHFNNIIVLTGNRALDAAVESLEGCKTEAEAARALCKDMPMIRFVEVNTGRPTTDDTVKAFRKQYPDAKSCLFISNQPYCLYQEAVAQCETAGPAANPSKQNSKVLLDTIARWLRLS